MFAVMLFSAISAFLPGYMNLQDGIKQTEVDAYVAQQFQQADTDGDGQVTFEDFCNYYQAMSISKARLELRATMGMEAERAWLIVAAHDTDKMQAIQKCVAPVCLLQPLPAMLLLYACDLCM